MRLIELNPQWVGLAPGHAIGITFMCPCCLQVRVGVVFSNPLGSAPLFMGTFHIVPLPFSATWTREGETFENLTLTPETDRRGHWHGHIVRGEVLP